MIDATVIVDASVIVGLVYQKDQWHSWAQEQAYQLSPPFFTCEGVIAEACFLLTKVARGEQQVLGMVADGHLRISFSLSEEIRRVKALMKKYENVPMSFVDACLVRMCETLEDSVVFTVDSDFLIYRKNGKRGIPLIYPGAKKAQ